MKILKNCLNLILLSLLTSCASELSSSSLDPELDITTPGEDDSNLPNFQSIILNDNLLVPGGDLSGSDQCSNIALDSLNNVYCLGSTTGSIGEQNGGGSDIFIIKFSPTGEIVWSRQFGNATLPPVGDNSGNQNCSDFLIDEFDYLYCIGSTSASLAGQNAGSNDIFLFKMDSDGEVVWFRQYGGDGNESCSSIATGPDGSIYCGGSVTGVFPGSGASNMELHTDALVIKFNPQNGDVVWVNQTRVPGVDLNYFGGCLDIFVNSRNEAYCSGYASFIEDSQNNVYFNTGLLVKVQNSGETDWFKTLPNDFGLNNSNPGGETVFTKMTIDSENNLYVMANTNEIWTDQTSTLSDPENILIIKLDEIGNTVWARHKLPQVENDYFFCSDILNDSNNNVYCLGGSNVSSIYNLSLWILSTDLSNEEVSNYNALDLPGGHSPSALSFSVINDGDIVFGGSISYRNTDDVFTRDAFIATWPNN